VITFSHYRRLAGFPPRQGHQITMSWKEVDSSCFPGACEHLFPPSHFGWFPASTASSQREWRSDQNELVCSIATCFPPCEHFFLPSHFVSSPNSAKSPSDSTNSHPPIWQIHCMIQCLFCSLFAFMVFISTHFLQQNKE
jgi:hypothetical protein